MSSKGRRGKGGKAAAGGGGGGRGEEEEDDDDVEDIDAGGLNLAENPALLAALQARLAGMAGESSGYLESLPKSIQRRLNFLTKLQLEHVKLEVEFQKAIAALERQFEPKFKALYSKRLEVIKGDYEPTAEEAKPRVPEPEAAAESSTDPAEEGADLKGIPSFWLSALSNCDFISQMIEEHDQEVLDSLANITVDLLEGDCTGFRLNFHFAPNAFFTNEVLTKTYHLRPDPDEEDIMYEGPVYVRSEGTEINWKEDKNVTVTKIKKKQRKKGGQGAGKVRTVVKTEKRDSFFNFFSPPVITEGEECDEQTQHLLAADYEVGNTIKEKIVPHAVLWFTGEARDYESFYGDEEEEDGEGEDGEGGDDDDDDDEAADPDYKPNPAEKPAECKQS